VFERSEEMGGKMAKYFNYVCAQMKTNLKMRDRFVQLAEEARSYGYLK
jgi:hypothetical protein